MDVSTAGALTEVLRREQRALLLEILVGALYCIVQISTTCVCMATTVLPQSFGFAKRAIGNRNGNLKAAVWCFYHRIVDAQV